MGQRGRKARPMRRASSWTLRISRTQCSRVAAIAWCMLGGSLPSTKYGVYPYPVNSAVSSSRLMRARIVGLLIL